MRSLIVLFALTAYIGRVLSHGAHGIEIPVADENADWMTRHMIGNAPFRLVSSVSLPRPSL